LAGVPENPHDESPDEEHGHEEAPDDGAGCAWDPATAESIRKYVAEAIAPLTQELSSRLAEAITLYVRQFQADWSSHPPKIEVSPKLLEALERWRAYLPVNWPRGVDLRRITAVIQEDGLPLVWVPPATVVEEVLKAPDRNARVAVLLRHETDLLGDCRRVLRDVTAERMSAQLPLAPAALAALEAGHHETAQALAVVVTDAVIKDWIEGKWEAVAEQVHFDPEEVSITEVRLQAAVAPIANFKRRYFATANEERPEVVNRQVTVHYADAAHFTGGNALVACLLMTSVLRALQEFEERYEDEGDDR
jgi:hypothetical protein